MAHRPEPSHQRDQSGGKLQRSHSFKILICTATPDLPTGQRNEQNIKKTKQLLILNSKISCMWGNVFYLCRSTYIYMMTADWTYLRLFFTVFVNWLFIKCFHNALFYTEREGTIWRLFIGYYAMILLLRSTLAHIGCVNYSTMSLNGWDLYHCGSWRSLIAIMTSWL